MVDYVGNSKKDKEEKVNPEITEKVTVKKKVEKVVTGKVVEKKPSIGQKMKGIFFGAGFKATGFYILEEVLLPSVRDLIVDTIRRGTERAVYGEAGYRTRRDSREYGPRQSYNTVPVRRQVYETTARERAHLPDQPMRPRNRRGGLEFILQTRSEAEDVLEQLSAALEKYEYVTVADLRETLGLKIEYTDNKWGWTVLNDVEIRQIREGFLLDLPPAEAL